ncbi:hypothetical protein N0V82_006087 [Gnomoniopsis sp. IMI 355080]|nr:hypothetical protein N0V82_006087 [Gnomoniopsis sp. IMI 355080]
MVPVFTNNSCSPWADRESPCEIGAYVQYAVNVSTTEHVTKTINFVHRKNVRLVIRNTGHEYDIMYKNAGIALAYCFPSYLGKSSGPFSLALWMHHLTSVSVLSWSDDTYHGPAINLSAGVQGGDLLAFAAQHNLTALTGTCPSVGVAGGYIQGGGHSALSSKYGLAADQLLDMVIVDAQGDVKTINRKSDMDLFWALSGGGGGTFAVVLSVTIRAYPDLPSATVTMEFGAGKHARESYQESIRSYLASLPGIHDAGCTTTNTFTRHGSQLSLMCHGKSSNETSELLSPLQTTLNRLHIPSSHTLVDLAKWSDGARKGWVGAEQYIVNHIQAATWLIPQLNVLDPIRNTETVKAMMRVQDLGAIVGTQSFSPSRAKAAAADNAVFPGWREAALMVWVILPTNDSLPMARLLEDQQRLSKELLPIIQAVAPDAGTYLNEADPVDENWKRNYYGSNYERLLAIKKRYDPEGIFYARHSVGSDAWVERHDGRLCRVEKDWPPFIDEL